MPIRFLFAVCFLVYVNKIYSQDSLYARYIIDTLGSPQYLGRGYFNNADKKAAIFIANELKKANIKPIDTSFFQYFTIDANVIEKTCVIINNDTLKPAIDYLIHSSSPSIDGSFEVVVLNAKLIANKKKYQKFKKQNFTHKFVLVDTTGLNDNSFDTDYKNIVNNNTLKAKGIITFSKNLFFTASTEQKSFVRIEFQQNLRSLNFKKIEIKVLSNFLKKYKTQNVVGYIRGKVDTFIFITAHYDHIGIMGHNVYFPGANDNASGVALTLDLARKLADTSNTPHYSIAFIFFSAEESGLLGSFYFVQNPLIPLKKIKFVLNLDVIGTGENGLQVVNSTIFKEHFAILDSINKNNGYFKQIKTRGAAANSDHYPFYAVGIPSFFVYSLGNYPHYHNIYDTPQNVPLSAYCKIFSLLYEFALCLKHI